MSQRKEEKRYELILKRGFPYPWDFYESSESIYAGKDYEQYWTVVKDFWEEKEIEPTPPA